MGHSRARCAEALLVAAQKAQVELRRRRDTCRRPSEGGRTHADLSARAQATGQFSDRAAGFGKTGRDGSGRRRKVFFSPAKTCEEQSPARERSCTMTTLQKLTWDRAPGLSGLHYGHKPAVQAHQVPPPSQRRYTRAAVRWCGLVAQKFQFRSGLLGLGAHDTEAHVVLLAVLVPAPARHGSAFIIDTSTYQGLGMGRRLLGWRQALRGRQSVAWDRGPQKGTRKGLCTLWRSRQRCAPQRPAARQPSRPSQLPTLQGGRRGDRSPRELGQRQQAAHNQPVSPRIVPP